MSEPPPIVLASASAARRDMLTRAGIAFSVEPALIHEAALKDALFCLPFADLAIALAEHKALDVSRRHPSAFVIGSDQILNLGDDILSKAATRAEAKQTLLALNGRTHELHSGCALAKDGVVIWRYVETARLTMRQVSERWLENYLERAGDALTNSVGAYYLEGLGLQLFQTIEGDYFTILGMPLLPLLGELRRQGVLPA